jgi:fatty acid desaturase
MTRASSGRSKRIPETEQPVPFAFRRLAWQNLLVIGYIVASWVAGLWLLGLADWALNGLGVLLVAHSLVCAAYLLHDCLHNAVFAASAANNRLGISLSWLCGACYAPYANIKEKHLRHHADRLDVVTFDYRTLLRRAPRWVLRAVLAVEWAYLPAVELLMHGLVIAAPFVDGTRRDRRRVSAVLAARLALAAVLAFISPKALLLYALAYLLFLGALRFMDAFQHTYEVFATRSLQRPPEELRRDRRYEYENTYSNLLSTRRPWLNLLALNFAYHNAHHARPAVPWYRLPALHRKLYGETDRQVIGARRLLGGYHRHRVARVLAADYGKIAADGDRAAGFIGAVGVSFLTAV